MNTGAPLEGLRVLEYATGIAGPYAGRLLAMCGATVVKVEPEGGDPTRSQPVDDEPVGATSPLYTHLNAAKLNVGADAVDPDWAHIVLDSRTSHEGGDPQGSTTWVSITPWGFDSERSGGVDQELLVQAASGLMGLNGDPQGPPLKLPGWQSQYFAGAVAANAALSGLRKRSRHVEVTWLSAFLIGIEIMYGDALHCDRPRQPPGPSPRTAFPSGAFRCKDGHVAPGSIRAVDWELQALFYGLEDLASDPEYTNRLRRVAHIDELRTLIQPWYDERTKREIFQLALDTPWAVGMVMTPTDALVDEHLAHRGLIVEAETEHGRSAVISAPFKRTGMPVGDHRVRRTGADAGFDAGSGGAKADLGALRRTEGLRLIEMTTSWAGPFVGKFLGAMGVDVIKIEAQRSFDGWRALRPYDHGMAPGQVHLVGDERFFSASGLFNAVNRDKRGCVLDVSVEQGRAALLDLVRNADALVANYTARVLPALGLDWETLHAVNPALVVVRMPAFGVEGPYSAAAGYGSIVEAMSGLGHRQGYEHEEARISNVYFPDPVGGIHAALAVLTGLHQRDLTGTGAEIDLSQQETSWLHSGEAISLAATTGRDIGRMGNREPGTAVSGVWRCADHWWVVVVGPESCRPIVASAATLTAAELVAEVRRVGGDGELVTSPWSAPSGGHVGPNIEAVDHPVTGPIRQLLHPVTYDGVRPLTRRHAPCFDEHSDEVMAEVAGYSDERIASLRSSKVLGGTLPAPAALGLHFDLVESNDPARRPA